MTRDIRVSLGCHTIALPMRWGSSFSVTTAGKHPLVHATFRWSFAIVLSLPRWGMTRNARGISRLCVSCHHRTIAPYDASKTFGASSRPARYLLPFDQRRHLIAFDGGRDLSFGSDTPVSLTLSCVGSAEGCHCTDVTGPIPGPGGSRTGCGRSIFGAGNGSTSARFSEAACVVQAWVEVETLRRGGETIVSGRGVLAFSDGGQYLLPSIVEADMHVSSGAEVLCAQWKTELAGALNATQGGVLWFAGRWSVTRSRGLRSERTCA